MISWHGLHVLKLVKVGLHTCCQEDEGFTWLNLTMVDIWESVSNSYLDLLEKFCRKRFAWLWCERKLFLSYNPHLGLWVKGFDKRCKGDGVTGNIDEIWDQGYVLRLRCDEYSSCCLLFWCKVSIWMPWNLVPLSLPILTMDCFSHPWM